MNREEIDLLSGSLACDQELTDEQRMLTLARCMSSNKQKLLALEYLEKHEASEHQSFIEVRRGKWTEPERIRWKLEAEMFLLVLSFSTTSLIPLLTLSMIRTSSC